MLLPRMRESPLHPRSPHPALGERRRDLAAEPGLALLVMPRDRARGWLPGAPRSGIRRARGVRPGGTPYPGRSIARARSRPDAEPACPRRARGRLAPRRERERVWLGWGSGRLRSRIRYPDLRGSLVCAGVMARTGSPELLGGEDLLVAMEGPLSELH